MLSIGDILMLASILVAVVVVPPYFYRVYKPVIARRIRRSAFLSRYFAVTDPRRQHHDYTPVPPRASYPVTAQIVGRSRGVPLPLSDNMSSDENEIADTDAEYRYHGTSTDTDTKPSVPVVDLDNLTDDQWFKATVLQRNGAKYRFSANKIFEMVGGNRGEVMARVAQLRAGQAPEQPERVPAPVSGRLVDPTLFPPVDDAQLA